METFASLPTSFMVALRPIYRSGWIGSTRSLEAIDSAVNCVRQFHRGLGDDHVRSGHSAGNAQMIHANEKPVPASIIVADVGGTNARFAIAAFGGDESERIALREVCRLENAGFGDFGELMAVYLAQAGAAAPRIACLGIAGPVRAHRGRITNLGWSLDEEQLRGRFGLDQVVLVNDFAALARMVPSMPEGATQSLTRHIPSVPGPRSVIGPGTGFGVALVIGNHGDCSTISTECGHMSFAPTTPFERDLKCHLESVLGHVSVESLLSGAGLVRIHEFLVSSTGCEDHPASAADITQAAIDGGASCCTAAVQHFLSILGSTAGDIALAHGATGGVYLAGGILPRIADLLHASNFLQRFVDKGPMRDYLARIPVQLITAPDIALLGAAVLYRESRMADLPPAGGTRA